MPENEQQEFIYLIARFLAGEATPEETSNLTRWVESSALNKQYYDEVRNIWEAFSSKMKPESIDTEKALSIVLGKISDDSGLKTAWIFWKKIAAVALIPLLIGNLIWFYINSHEGSFSTEPIYNEIFAAFGTRTAIKLADGSSVWLNSGSSLRYPERFKGKERKVYLIGEGYFEIATNPSVPFIVTTSALIVKATGTKFNVSDHISDLISEVTLVSGKVFVNELIPKNGHKQSIELLPSQRLVYNKENGTNSIQKEDVNEYISWKDGKLIFRNKPLSYVVNKISQMFNVDIELKGSVLQDYRYRATFEDESLTEILRLLKLSSPIDYVEVKRDPLPDGSFPKKKVVIFPKDK
jgi:ferric-dicitrate binding protein FerR (iron transport regulator)